MVGSDEGMYEQCQMAWDYSQKFVLIDVINQPWRHLYMYFFHFASSNTWACICAFGIMLNRFSFCLFSPFFFKADVLSEDTILKWYNEAHVAKGKSVFIEQMKTFVQWLKNAEEGRPLKPSGVIDVYLTKMVKHTNSFHPSRVWIWGRRGRLRIFNYHLLGFKPT